MNTHIRSSLSDTDLSVGPTTAGATVSAGFSSRGRAIDEAQARYDRTRSHEALVRLKDAVHAVLAVELVR